MKQVIGFATEYYTLWNCNVEGIYFTDSYGQHHLVREKTNYFYCKNISTDIEKAKSLYPNVAIDDSLHGKQRDFSTCDSNIDQCPEWLKFGKYIGRSIFEVAEFDFGYVLWLCENGYPATRDFCMSIPKVINHFVAIEQEEADKRNSHPVAESGEVEITFVGNPRYMEDSAALFAAATIGEGNEIYVQMSNVKYVDGRYPYYLGVINGKAQRLKGKTIKLNLEITSTQRGIYAAVQYAKIA